MKKSIKRYLAFILAFAMMATYSFGPQNINVFAENEDQPTTVAAQQDNSGPAKTSGVDLSARSGMTCCLT